MSLVLVFMSVTMAYSVDVDNYDEIVIQSEYDNEMNKLHFYFSTNDDGSGSARTLSSQNTTTSFNYIDDKNELDLAIENMTDFCEVNSETDGLVQMTVEFHSDFINSREYNELLEERENIETIEDNQAFRSKLNALSKEHHVKENAENIKKFYDIDYENIYASTYSPFISLTIDNNNVKAEDLLALSQDDSVANVSLSYQEEASDCTSWDRTLKEIGAYSTVHKGLYTGEGVKIGVLENGVCDTTHTNLSGKTIHIDPYCTGEVTEHATATTSIISIMAPDAEIYVSNSNDSSREEDNNYRKFSDAIDWFISQGCDIINCSYHYLTGAYETGRNNENKPLYDLDLSGAIYRHDIDGLFDYYVKSSYINFVVSAGNASSVNTSENYNPDGYVRSPALAYNVITVGALDCSLSSFDYDLEHSSYSCYKTTENRVKPEISAIGTVKIPNVGTCRGTSFSAPLVTACIALMLEKGPDLSTTTQPLKAALIATATQTENYTNISNSYFDNKVGSGCVNFSEFSDIDNLHYMERNKETVTSNSFVWQNTISFNKNDDLQMAAFWSAIYNTNDRLTYVTNYDLYLYNSSGILVASSTLDYGSNEFIRYTVPSTGDYTVKIYLNGDITEEVSNDVIGLSCNVIS